MGHKTVKHANKMIARHAIVETCTSLLKNRGFTITKVVNQGLGVRLAYPNSHVRAHVGSKRVVIFRLLDDGPLTCRRLLMESSAKDFAGKVDQLNSLEMY